MKILKVYHGTNVIFDKFDEAKARIKNDYYGGGVAYFTDNLEVAKDYAKSMSKSTGNQLVYSVSLQTHKTFDIDENFTGKELTKFFNKNAEEFCRGAGLLKLGVDKYKILTDVESGTAVLTGDQIFAGLSSGMTRTLAARQKLISLGYDSLRYNGGEIFGAIKHNVWLTYKASNVSIIKIYMYDERGNKYERVRG